MTVNFERIKWRACLFMSSNLSCAPGSFLIHSSPLGRCFFIEKFVGHARMEAYTLSVSHLRQDLKINACLGFNYCRGSMHAW